VGRGQKGKNCHGQTTTRATTDFSNLCVFNIYFPDKGEKNMTTMQNILM
jgi:hypothetical protein